ncbi:MAG: hypothetical protein J1G38_06320 [Clostridiales bacterium]|nr:hypothetical protein [Clostridiales bacterium]
MERSSRKNQNVFVRYFTPFGLRQVCDFVMLIGFVLLIVGLCTNESVLLVGFIFYLVGSLGAVVRCCITLFTTENHRDPAFKTAIINVVIMGILFALALFGMIWTIAA